MKNPDRKWLVILAAISLLAIPGCSDDDDDLTDIPVEEAVEAGLNDVLENTVEPLFVFLAALPDLVAGPPSVSPAGGPVCPDTGEVCTGGGSLTCTPSGFTTLEFDFDECVVVTGDGEATLDGGVDATVLNTLSLVFADFFIDDSPALTGTGQVDVDSCNYVVNVDTDDGATVDGAVIQCEDVDEFPQDASTVWVAFDDFLILIDFDGGPIATAVASQGDTVVANCDIDLEDDPISSTCDAV
jgi:hypothetical protein